jgi:hypothetical protein
MTKYLAFVFLVLLGCSSNSLHRKWKIAGISTFEGASKDEQQGALLLTLVSNGLLEFRDDSLLMYNENGKKVTTAPYTQNDGQIHVSLNGEEYNYHIQDQDTTLLLTDSSRHIQLELTKL